MRNIEQILSSEDENKYGILNKIKQGFQYLNNTSVEDGFKDAMKKGNSIYKGFIESFKENVRENPEKAMEMAQGYVGAMDEEKRNEFAKKGIKRIYQMGGFNSKAFKELKKKHNNFTLIELLTVIGVIGILAGILMPALSVARRKAKETNMYNNIRQIMVAVESYEMQWDHFPPGDGAGRGVGEIDYLEKQLKDAGYSMKEEMFKDMWGNEMKYFSKDFYNNSIPFFWARAGPNFHKRYNPKSYQLFTKGKDGQAVTMDFAPINKDNLWVDTKNHIVIPFEKIDGKDLGY